MFSFEALRAKHGDALLVHYGPEDDPQMVVVDGGPHDVWEESLLPRLEEICDFREIRPVPARLVMVSHIDDDHIVGVNDMLTYVDRENDPAVEVTSLWHNSFDSQIGNSELAMLEDLGAQAASTAATLGTSQWILAMAAGVVSGKRLRRKARRLGLVVNAGGTSVPDFIAEGDRVRLGDGLTLRVLNPDKGQLQGLQRKWDGQANRLRDLSRRERRMALASIAEDSLANISSIVVHLEKGGHTMLLTGDARGDHVTKGLARAGLLPNGRTHVDILKVPHHGSDRNVDKDFFEAVKADHYVFSGDQDPGFGRNPDTTTLKMLTDVRGRGRYTMHFTYMTSMIRDWLRRDRQENTRRYTVSSTDDQWHGLWIDLEEDLWF